MNIASKRVELGTKLEEAMMLSQRAQTALQQTHAQIIALKAQLQLLDELEHADGEEGAKVVKSEGE